MTFSLKLSSACDMEEISPSAMPVLRTDPNVGKKVLVLTQRTYQNKGLSADIAKGC